MEASGKLLSESIKIANSTEEILKIASGKAGKEMYAKFKAVID